MPIKSRCCMLKHRSDDLSYRYIFFLVSSEAEISAANLSPIYLWRAPAHHKGIHKTDPDWRTRMRCAPRPCSVKGPCPQSTRHDLDSVSLWARLAPDYKFDGSANDPRSGRQPYETKNEALRLARENLDLSKTESSKRIRRPRAANSEQVF
jgi:hypothetical protein